MKALLGKRIVLVTGKGGVGRSSVSAALGLLAQRAGKRVLLTEMDDGSEAYSPLAHLFGLPRLPRTAAVIAPGISGSQLRADVGVELFLTSVLRVPALARSALKFEPLRRLFLAVPSLRELGVFFHLLSYLQAELKPSGPPRYELVIADMPATGHTLALTGLPKVVLGLIHRGPIADALRAGQSYLNDPARAGAYVVTLPEELPVSEALELLDGLERTNVPCGGLFVNRVPPALFSVAEAEALKGYLAGRSVFGTHGFHRTLEARSAIERLRRSTSMPTMELPELEQVQAELVPALADALAAGVFQPGLPLQDKRTA